jgi:hypothetical protein
MLGGVQQHQLRRPLDQIGDRPHQLRPRQPHDTVGGLLKGAGHLAEAAGVKELAQQLLLLHRLVAAFLGLGGDPGIEQGAAIAVGPGAVLPGFAVALLAPAGGLLPEAFVQVAAPFRPQLPEALPALHPEPGQPGRQRLVPVAQFRRWIELQGRIAVQPPQDLFQALRRHTPAAQPGEQRRRQGQQLALAVVVHHLGDQGVAIALQLQLRRAAGLERRAPQAAAAKAMDGGDIGGVELLECQQQPAAQHVDRIGPGRPPLGQPFLQHRIRSLPFGLLQSGEPLLQAPADAVAQFGGGGLGEAHHQDAGQRQARLGHQAQHQMGQGEGLARAGAGLEQPQARGEREAIGFERLAGWARARLTAGGSAVHRFFFTSACSIGP